jgi:energy-converting hydrogenase Eha subunit C
MFKIKKFTRICGPMDRICALMIAFGFAINFADVPSISSIYDPVCILIICIAVSLRARTVVRTQKAMRLRYEKRKKSETKKAALLAAHRSTLEEK